MKIVYVLSLILFILLRYLRLANLDVSEVRHRFFIEKLGPLCHGCLFVQAPAMALLDRIELASRGRRLDSDAKFSCDRCKRIEVRHAARTSCVQFSKHLVQAAAWCAQNQQACRLVAGIIAGCTNCCAMEMAKPEGDGHR
jgi:hypothetical protein